MKERKTQTRSTMQGKRCYYYVITSRNATPLTYTLGEAYDLILLLLLLLFLGQSKITRSIFTKDCDDNKPKKTKRDKTNKR
jgi:hypothetical protein